MKAIKLRIRKKTLVPTKKQIVHQYRSDWILAGVIDYSDSFQLFKSIGSGPIETDAQFAAILKQTYGVGIYSILAWRKGRSGFWSFLYIEIANHGFRRLKKQRTTEEKEIDSITLDIKQLKNRLSESKTVSDRENIQQKIDELNEERSFSKEIVTLDRLSNGPYPYLKQSHPIYKFHSYEEIKKEDIQEVEQDDFW